MERNIFEKQRELNDRLNRYRDEYYNRNAPSVSDEVYDRLFDELKELEQETGIQMANSPTQTVGYPAVSRLEKTRHEIPLLSLDICRKIKLYNSYLDMRKRRTQGQQAAASGAFLWAFLRI